MSRRSEKIFFQRKQTDGQQAHEKMLNITSQQEMKIETTWDITRICQNGHHQKEHK